MCYMNLDVVAQSSYSLCLSLCQHLRFDYCSFIVSFEIGKCESYNFVLFFLQDCFGSSGSLVTAYGFEDWLSYFC